MRIVLLGFPGSGKGTQAKMMAEKYRVPQISTGDILRAAVADKTEIGKKVAAVMAAGKLVSDDIVIDAVTDRLRGTESRRGFVLDGFPRTVAQADGLAVLLAQRSQRLDAVLSLEVTDEELVDRISGRRVCETCNHVTHVRKVGSALECPDCEGKLVQRSDDEIATVRNRLAVYREKTQPLQEYYAKDTVGLTAVDGMGFIDEIQERLLVALRDLGVN